MSEPAQEEPATTSGGVVFTLSIDDIGAQLVAERVFTAIQEKMNHLPKMSGRIH